MNPGVEPPEYDRRIRGVVSKSPWDIIVGMTLMLYLLYAAPQLTNLCQLSKNVMYSINEVYDWYAEENSNESESCRETTSKVVLC